MAAHACAHLFRCFSGEGICTSACTHLIYDQINHPLKLQKRYEKRLQYYTVQDSDTFHKFKSSDDDLGSDSRSFS